MTGSAYLCKSAQDCVDNFDAIYKEYEGIEEKIEGSEPKKGDMGCGMTNMKGQDENGDDFDVNFKMCHAGLGCQWGFTNTDSLGITMSLPANGCAEAATQLVAGVAAAVAVMVAADL